MSNSTKTQEQTQKKTRSIEEIVSYARQELLAAQIEGDLERVLEIRGKTLAPFIGLIQLGEEITEWVKAQKFPQGTYGSTYLVKIADEMRSDFNHPALIDLLEEGGYDLKEYAKADTTKQVVKDLIINNPHLNLAPKSKAIKKHSFKPF